MTATLTEAPPAATARAADPVRSPWRMAGRRFLRHHLAVAGLVVVLVLVLACFGSIPWTTQKIPPGGQSENAVSTPQTWISRYENQRMEPQYVRRPPDSHYWMGTDASGRDLRARFLLGGAISLSIGLCSALIAVAIGTTVGLLAGYLGGRTDAFLMRLVDVLYGLPYILLVILMRVALVPTLTGWFTWTDSHGIVHDDRAGMWANFLVLLVGIGAVSWLTLARVVRGQVMSLREQPFIEAARALGFSWPRIVRRHILPNLLGTIIVYGTLTVPNAILSESFLSFLGLGIQAPLPSWGNLASDGMEALNPVAIRWWLITWPCAGLSLALLALNFVGDGVHDALDPRAQ